MSEECLLWVLENQMLRISFGSNRYKLIGEWKKLIRRNSVDLCCCLSMYREGCDGWSV
jgi:hypothetical protein